MRGIHLILAAITLLAVNCEESNNECDFQEFEQCYFRQSLDSSQIANTLVGKWRWDYMLNCTAGPRNNKDVATYSGIAVEFLADGRFVLHRPNSTSSFHWTLDSTAYNGWKIVDPGRLPFPPHESLYGRIRLCGNRLLANAGNLDGADNFFVKE